MKDAPSALIFGPGYLGGRVAFQLRALGWNVAATARTAQAAADVLARGFSPVATADLQALTVAWRATDAVLVTTPPDEDGCPAYRLLSRLDPPAPATWIGYVSTTGVYGDRDGGWVDERSALNAASVEGARRVAAERAWRALGGRVGATACMFRLPAIYGSGRSPFARLRAGQAVRVRKPRQVFNRIHVDDACEGILASLRRPRAGGVYNLCDDHPAPAAVFTEFAAALLGLPPPPEVDWSDPSVTAASRRFYADSKRVSNARAKAELGWRPRFPDWRDGLRAVLEEESLRPPQA